MSTEETTADKIEKIGRIVERDGVELKVLAPGTYRLTCDINNPKADRRHTLDWTKEPTWRAGLVIRVRDENAHDALAEGLARAGHKIEPHKFLWTSMLKVGFRWTHMRLTPHDSGYQALVDSLEPIEQTDRAWLDEQGVDNHFAAWLLTDGGMSREALLKLWNKYQGEE
jgi:hypothetical protein